MTRELLNIKQVQEILHLSERTVFRLIKAKELKGFKAGREWRFEQKDIDDYIERQRRKADEDTDKRPALNIVAPRLSLKQKGNS
jgi:excisionase family DNA binding protein